MKTDYGQYKIAGQAQTMPKTVKEILIQLVVECEISRQEDKKRNYMKSQHEIYNKAILALSEVVVPEKKDCAYNKKWQSTYPKDCENIGWNACRAEVEGKFK